jgi:hypothetical protein
MQLIKFIALKFKILHTILFLFFIMTALVAFVLVETQKRMITFTGSSRCTTNYFPSRLCAENPCCVLFALGPHHSAVPEPVATADPVRKPDRGVFRPVTDVCAGPGALVAS